MAVYYTIEITYTDPEDHAAKIHRLKNYTPTQLIEFRQRVWYEGFYLPVNGSTLEGYLLGPQSIRFIYTVKQDKKHFEQ